MTTTTAVPATTTESLSEEERILTSSYEWGESEEVIALQELLGLPADGTYGRKTRVAHLQALAQQVPWFRTDNVPSPPQTIDKLEASISSTGATVEGLGGPVISDITFPETYDSINQWDNFESGERWLLITARVTGEDLTLVYLESYSGPICNNARHMINLRGDVYPVENRLDLTTPFGRAQLLEGEVAYFSCIVYDDLPAGPMDFRFGATDEQGNLTISEEFTVVHVNEEAILTASYEWGQSEKTIKLQEILGLSADGWYGEGTRSAHIEALETRGLSTDAVPYQIPDISITAINGVYPLWQGGIKSGGSTFTVSYSITECGPETYSCSDGNQIKSVTASRAPQHSGLILCPLPETPIAWSGTLSCDTPETWRVIRVVVTVTFNDGTRRSSECLCS
tara:strand:- start:97 stop:1287 length:1191 start_codon:yes stop_codon:yes gene_type:complete